MTKNLFKPFLISFLAASLFACSESEPERPLGEYEQGILIMNEGAFGVNDGEVFHLNTNTGELKSNVFELENGRPFAGLLQDMILEEERLYLVANTGKVEIVDARDFKSIGSVTGDLDISRSLTVNSGKLFISDYGPYAPDFSTPDSYVAVVNTQNGVLVSKKIPVSRKPEDMIASGKYVLVASSEEGKVEIIDAQTEEIFKTINVEGRPMKFFEANGSIFLYSITSEEVIFYSFHLDNFTLATTNYYPIINATGKIAVSPEGVAYMLTSSGWPDYQDGIAKLALFGPEIDLNWYTGSGFYGIGYDPIAQEIYVSNSNGFQGNGSVTILDKEGTEIRNFEVGRGPSGFLFR
ncbi:DUF5074 domain-containing protein [uncultured Algoriphagus sp.]|uniref:DUF5074 domain-containing protein n=1 Tax=uncultured Algoriphagus sp. TaxID=417365 RepID=UPI00258F9FC0|nr:DUF5074 domain-containing protein [uncultured Algoriphagus sp.]